MKNQTTQSNSAVGSPTALFATAALLLASLSHPALAVPANLTINATGTLSPNFTIKRGDVMKGPVFTATKQEAVTWLGSNGFKLLNLFVNLNETSMAEAIYLENGVLKHRPHTDFNDWRRHAVDSGLTVIAQVGGTPSEIPTDPAYTNDPAHSDFQPIPTPANFQTYADVVGPWMAAANTNTPSIWIGQQETSHTIGFVNGTQTDAKLATNVSRYADLWSRVHKKAAGTRGAMQLNAENRGKGLYQLALDELVSRNASPTYYTVQNYQGENTTEIVSELRGIVGTRKVIFNRYGYNKADNATNTDTAAGMIRFLKAELQIANNADLIYGYALKESGFSSNPEWLGAVGQFLNSMPTSRRPITWNSSGLGGFATASTTEMKFVVWNTTGSSREITLEIQNAPAGWNAASARKAGASIIATSVTWNNPTNKLTGLTLANGEFALVRIYQN